MMDYEAIYQSNPVLYQDIKELIEFALDCTGLILGSLTGTAYATTYSNIDDLEGTLMYTKLGLKYQHYDLELKEKAFAEELKHKLRGENND